LMIHVINGVITTKQLDRITIKKPALAGFSFLTLSVTSRNNVLVLTGYNHHALQYTKHLVPYLR